MEQFLKTHKIERFTFSRNTALAVVSVFLSFLVVLQVLALNDTVKQWNFNTASAGQYTTGGTPVTIDDSGARPNANKFTNAYFDSSNSNWIVAAIAPAGWVEVPGNQATYGTSNFLVMKYEAKCANTSDPTTGLTTPDTGSHTYANNTTACTSANSKQVVSVASGYPIANISQTTSIGYCTSVPVGGTSAHLISNNEWMTMARNIEAQNVNWSLGTVGSGYLYAGHNDNSPALALPASSNDANKAAYTNSAGDTEALTSASNTASGQSATVGNQVRVLQLSNGSNIWDLAGNVWEWNSDTITEQDGPDQAGNDGGAYRQFTAITDWGPRGVDAYRPANASFTSTQGVGTIYSVSNSASTALRAFLRGGSWAFTSNAGVFSLSLASAPADTGPFSGFRCASDPVDISSSYSSSSGREAGGGNEVAVGNVANGKIYQIINVGDTSTYDFSATVKDNTAGNEGGVVDNSVAQLYQNGNPISTTYTPLADGWYKLSATITGANANVEYGVAVKRQKDVFVDNFRLEKQSQTYSLFTNSAYSNGQVSNWDTFCEGTLLASTCTPNVVKPEGSSITYQLCDDDGSACQSGSSWKYWDGDSWETASTPANSNPASDLTLSVMHQFPAESKKIAVKAFFHAGEFGIPILHNLSIGLTTDLTPPNNISEINMKRSTSSVGFMNQNDWTNQSSPYFEWDEAHDNVGGVGIMGYCLYLSNGDTSPNLETATSPYLPGNTNLDSTHITSAGTHCGNGSGFLVSTLNIDFANINYRGSSWLTSSNTAYYMYVASVDNAGNITDDPLVSFHFRFDNTPPTNVAYLACASGNFANVVDMNFSWPVAGSAASSDVDPGAGLLGWQYQINSTMGTWLGTTTDSVLGVGNYMPVGDSSRILTQEQDGDSIDMGSNIVYFRTVDAAGNVSVEATIRTCNLAFGGAAPTFGGADSVSVNPSTSNSNSFALSWPEATPAVDHTIEKYYYMVNALPPSILSTLQNNPSTYIDNGNNLTVDERSLPNVNKGTNTVYVVAVDDANNYSPSNYISGTFTLDSDDPDNVGSLTVSDSSIKAESKWLVTLSWTAPVYQGAGNLTYLINRSEDGVSFDEVGTTTGLSYVDSTPESKTYYYKVITKDGANSTSSGTNAVSITPTGRWTVPAPLEDGPNVINITTRKVTIQWSTTRTSDSKVQFGLSTGNYEPEEIGNSDQRTSHSINLNGLNPETIYYYRVKWTDEDGNTGSSEEKTFKTAPAPYVKDVSVTDVNLSSAVIKFTTVGAAKANVYYGKSVAFGGVVQMDTSTSETAYFTQITGLDDGTDYFYKINVLDEEGAEYSGTVLNFTTPPRPDVSNVRLQQVEGTAQSTILVTFTTNTSVSSIISYYPENDPKNVKEVVDTKYANGEHNLQISGLLPNTNYVLVVTVRDTFGNQVSSDPQRFTTAIDTRPPEISGLQVDSTILESSVINGSDTPAEIIITWTTDEPATSQVEFGVGAGNSYTQKTQEDQNLVLNHTVVIPSLSASQVYHIRVVSKDAAGNTANSVDMATITPKATDNVLELVLRSLVQLFRFQI